MRKPRPIAPKVDNNAGNPRQQSAAKIEAAMPTLSPYLLQNFFGTVMTPSVCADSRPCFLPAAQPNDHSLIFCISLPQQQRGFKSPPLPGAAAFVTRISQPPDQGSDTSHLF